MRRKAFAHDQGVITVTLWVALLVEVIFSFTILFFCMEFRAPLLEPCLLAGLADIVTGCCSGHNCPQGLSLCQAPW